MGRLSFPRMPGGGRYRPGGRRKSPVDSQFAWQVKKLSRKILLWLLVLALLFCMALLVRAMLLRSDIFRLTSVTVQGNQVTTQEQILKKAGLNRGVNLLSLDVARIKASVMEEQWVEQVWIKRRWPSTVEIIIREHAPFALINLEHDNGRQLYYMNNKGVVFAPSTAERDLDYPVVTGAGLPADIAGKRFEKDSLGGMALEFLKLTAMGNQVLPTQAVSEINVDPEKGLIVYLVDQPFPIYMGREQITTRFYRLVKVLAKLYKDDMVKGVTGIRMDYADKKVLVTRDEGG